MGCRSIPGTGPFVSAKNSYFMKTILLFGAGKSATVLIDYLLDQAPVENWLILVVDANL